MSKLIEGLIFIWFLLFAGIGADPKLRYVKEHKRDIIYIDCGNDTIEIVETQSFKKATKSPDKIYNAGNPNPRFLKLKSWCDGLFLCEMISSPGHGHRYEQILYRCLPSPTSPPPTAIAFNTVTQEPTTDTNNLAVSSLETNNSRSYGPTSDGSINTSVVPLVLGILVAVALILTVTAGVFWFWARKHMPSGGRRRQPGEDDCENAKMINRSQSFTTIHQTN